MSTTNKLAIVFIIFLIMTALFMMMGTPNVDSSYLDTQESTATVSEMPFSSFVE